MTNIKTEAGSMDDKRHPKSNPAIESIKHGRSDSISITRSPSVASMYQRAAYKTLAEIRIQQKKGVLENRNISNRFGKPREKSDEDELGQLGIIIIHVPVTWDEQLLRESGKIKNYCFRPSMLRTSWTISK